VNGATAAIVSAPLKLGAAFAFVPDSPTIAAMAVSTAISSVSRFRFCVVRVPPDHAIEIPSITAPLIKLLLLFLLKTDLIIKTDF
jgi:hypothetical protein